MDSGRRWPGTTDMVGDRMREMVTQDTQHCAFIHLRPGEWEKAATPEFAHAGTC